MTDAVRVHEWLWKNRKRKSTSVNAGSIKRLWRSPVVLWVEIMRRPRNCISGHERCVLEPCGVRSRVGTQRPFSL